VGSDFGSLIREDIQIINQPVKIKQTYLSLIRSARKEILVVFPTANAVRREESIGIIDELKKARERGVAVRILTPEDDFIREKLNKLKDARIDVRRIETPGEAKFKLLIIDRKVSLVVETADDSKSEFLEAIGLATLSSSKPTVLPYFSIFESFWRETDLYEKTAEADRIKDEFVNIAAHELRTPITPIIAAVEFIKRDFASIAGNLEKVVDDQTKKKFDDVHANLDMIARNTKKLLRLAEDILQVSRIQSGTFAIEMHENDVSAMIETTMQDIRKKYEDDRPNVMLRHTLSSDNRLEPLQVLCDGPKIAQTLFNLLDNAMKFTENGTVEIALNQVGNELVFSVRDSGAGIDPLIIGKLFEKFVTKSSGGTGLGLYLCKKIVEAHGGRIWGQNNMGATGATFSFTLPMDLIPNNPNDGKEKETIMRTR
jgi:signal transduction histidine kinase